MTERKTADWKEKTELPLHFKLAIIESFDNTDQIYILTNIHVHDSNSNGRASCKSRYSMISELKLTHTHTHSHGEKSLQFAVLFFEINDEQNERRYDGKWSKNWWSRYQKRLKSMKSVNISKVIKWNTMELYVDIATDLFAVLLLRFIGVIGESSIIGLNHERKKWHKSTRQTLQHNWTLRQGIQQIHVCKSMPNKQTDSPFDFGWIVMNVAKVETKETRGTKSQRKRPLHSPMDKFVWAL